MDTPLDLSRWREPPLAVWSRRWAIISTGLRQVTRTRFFRFLLILAWMAGLLLAVTGFLFTQSVATGGWLESFAAERGPRVQAIVSAFTAIVLLYPDICIGGLFTLLFWAHSFVGLVLSLLALSSIVPSLVTRDRASNALAIYLSRPLTSFDYLMGKLGIIVGVLVLVWTGPVAFAWLLSVLVAPEGDFLVYSLEPLGRALLFNLAGLVTIASVALGVSSLVRSSKATVLLWMGLWILAFGIAQFPTSPDWLRSLSFQYDLNRLRESVFALETILSDAAASLPLMNRNINEELARASEHMQAATSTATFAGLAVLIGGSLFVLFRRLRPE